MLSRANAHNPNEETDMKKSEIEKIKNAATTLAGKRRNRILNDREIKKMAELDRKKALAGKTIRVYSFDGFVPKSYNKGFYTPIDYIERGYDSTGKKIFTVSQAGANKPHGSGSLITVDGRAY